MFVVFLPAEADLAVTKMRSVLELLTRLGQSRANQFHIRMH